jgi:pilus assembly protein CpaC
MMPLGIRSTASSDAIHLIVGHSLVLTSAAPLRRIYVGDPAVLQTYTSGTSEVVLTAKTPGVSSLVFWDEAGAIGCTRSPSISTLLRSAARSRRPSPARLFTLAPVRAELP